MLFLDDDNWDDDFVTAISPSALQLPQLKPQDNFGGLLSSDRLKAFASMNDSRNESTNYDQDFEGELMTIKGPNHWDNDPQEQTIRPFKKPIKPIEPTKGHSRTKSSSRSTASVSGMGRKSPAKPHVNNKFELPSRPDLVYREQSVEDYSDLFVENESVFDNRVNQPVRKVRPILSIASMYSQLYRALGKAMPLNSFIHQILRAFPDPCMDHSVEVSRRRRLLGPQYYLTVQCDGLALR